jgi:formylglycine-generating enzyme required for sulfatase activity
VTYELLSGDLPFHGTDTLSMALAHVEQPIPRLSPLRRRWQPFIDKAMAKHPADRFQSAAEMAAALDAIGSNTILGPDRVASTSRYRPALILAGVVVLVGTVLIASAMFLARAPVAEVGNVSAPPAPGESAPSAAPSGSDAPAAPTSATTAAEPLPSASEALQVAPSQVDLAAGTALRDAGGPELVFVPATHEGTASGFALGRYEVTRGEYAAFAAATHRAPSACREPLQPWSRLRKLSWRDPAFAQSDQHPVVCVSWRDASAYTQWLSERTHAQYALPTRAEWLHAARSAPAGASACAQGNLAGHGALPFLRNTGCKSGFSHTAPVGRFKANAFGAFDLVGNVAEWTLGCKPGAIDKSGRCLAHVFSGTSWRDDAQANNLDVTGDADADTGYTTVGIRVLRKLDADNMPQQEN